MVRSRREAGGVVAAYKTIAARAEAEIVEKKSRFIGQIAPVATEEEALAFIAEVKAAHRMARHNVYAYVLRGGRVRYTDDGEPAKTAGMPTLEAIQHAGLEDVAVVVTRYFGGILLGTGGLVRAYSHGAKIALDAGRIITMALCQTAELVCDYNQYGRLLSLIPEAGGVVTDTQFTDVVEISFQIPGESLPALNRKLADATSGSVQAQVAGELFVEWKD